MSFTFKNDHEPKIMIKGRAGRLMNGGSVMIEKGRISVKGPLAHLKAGCVNTEVIEILKFNYAVLISTVLYVRSAGSLEQIYSTISFAKRRKQKGIDRKIECFITSGSF
jgi:hypothetical protein